MNSHLQHTEKREAGGDKEAAVGARWFMFQTDVWVEQQPDVLSWSFGIGSVSAGADSY